ncbi:oxidoreductase [Phaeovulum sp. W22_SRMD_FR3]|uniref:oxidoreductase n=1 Tax=Phaeovulum sp. W22_SRMD_FR3 TaxID=3240274 RepID=UPI003F9ADB98
MVSEFVIRSADLAGTALTRRRMGKQTIGHRAASLALALVAALGTVALTPPLHAQETIAPLTALPLPTGPIVLTVTGDISVTNQDGAAVFDDAMLATLPAISFTTTTNWTEGAHEFSGPALSTVLAALGAGPGIVDAKAANDYAVYFEPAEIGTDAPIITRLIDGKTFSLRDNGPLWVLYPYDSSADYETEKVYSLSIWQLASLHVRQP